LRARSSLAGVAAIAALSAGALALAVTPAIFRTSEAIALAREPTRATAAAPAARVSEASTVVALANGTSLRAVIAAAASEDIAPALAASQSAAPCLPLEARNPEGNYIVPGVRGAIIYRRVAGAAGAGATELSLDAYVQPGGGGPRPGVIVVHGGGWERGSRSAFIGQFLELLTHAGYNWVAVDYRLGTLADHERAVDDVEAAVAFVRCHARELEIDPARLVLWGEDTGAQLAALLASRPSSSASVRAMVLVGGIYDLHAVAIPRGTSTALVLQASPAHRLRRGMPSTLIVHGTGDSEVPATQASRYCAELHALRATCDIIEVDGASHRAENWWPSHWGYKARIVDWLSRTLSFTAPPASPAATSSSTASSSTASSSAPSATAASSGSASAAASPSVPSTGLTPGLHKDIVYAQGSGLKLDAYIPSVQGAATDPVPAVIIAHGGGWEAGDKVTYVTPLFEPLSKAGFAWFSIDYRLTPAVQHPAQLDDLRDAIRFVRENATRFNIDPNRIALLGESASGQMVMQVAATTTATTDAATAVAAVVSFYGVYDFEALVESSPTLPERSLHWRLFRLPTLDASTRAVLRAHSPIHQVRRGMPPVLLIHGTNERLWTQGQSMSRVLTERGVSHELLPLDGAPHGLENWEGHAPWMHYKPRLVAWLREQFRQNVPERE